jgi:hypothetical protein
VVSAPFPTSTRGDGTGSHIGGDPQRKEAGGQGLRGESATADRVDPVGARRVWTWRVDGEIGEFRRVKENSMRIVLSCLVVLALIGSSLGCWSCEYDNPAVGVGSVPVRHHGGEHFKVQDYTQIGKYWEKMASGELNYLTVTADDLPPAMADMSVFESSQVATIISGYYIVNQYCNTFDNTDPTNPTPSVTNPSIAYLLEMQNPSTEPTPFQPYNLAVNGMNMIGNSGYAGTAGVIPTSGKWYLAGICLNVRNTTDWWYAPNRVIATHDYDGDDVPDIPIYIGLLSSWNFGNVPVNYDGWGYEFLTISGNSSIKDSDGNTIDSVEDLINHVVQSGFGPLDLNVSLERVSLPEFGTIQLRRPLDMNLGDLKGRVNLVFNEHVDLVEQLVGHLERSGYKTGDGIDLGGMTLDFGDFTVTMPENYAKVDVLMDSMKSLIAEADRVSTRDRGFSRDRVRVR